MGFPGGASGKEPACQSRKRKRGGFDFRRKTPLEKGTATHSSILAWRMLWTEELSGPQSMGSDKTE